MVRALIIILLAGVVAGCATTQRHAEIMDSWLGAEINDLVASWGYPAGDFRAPNGNRVYVYENTATSQMPTIVQPGTATATTYGSTTTVQQGPTVVYGGGTRTNWCRMYFEVDSRDVIRSWRSEGNACRSR